VNKKTLIADASFLTNPVLIFVLFILGAQQYVSALWFFCGGFRCPVILQSDYSTVCPTRYRTRHFFNVMSTAIPGEVWRPTSAEQVQHLGIVKETVNQGDFIGRTYRRSS
jgi:hypothetical protein